MLKFSLFKIEPIITEYGEVSEPARFQAAENMRRDPNVKQRVIEHLVGKMGEKEGLKQAKRQFPECFGLRKVWLDLKERILGEKA